MLSPDTLISVLLARSPLVPALMIELRVDCVGCSMNRFCTLDDLCTHYQLDLETFTQKIQKELSKTKPHHPPG
jgi:hypothetical protein